MQVGEQMIERVGNQVQAKRFARRVDSISAQVFLVLLMIAGTSSPAVRAEPKPVPDLINYQGRVYLEDGSADVTGLYDIEFRLYHVSTDGTALWGERHVGVQVVRGAFSVILGAGARIDAPVPVPHDALADVLRSDEVFVELRVGDVAGPVPVRQRFSSTPHAYAARNAFTAIHGVPPGSLSPRSTAFRREPLCPSQGAMCLTGGFPATDEL